VKPLVSILIPAFNAQDWIADTIQSAAAQTWPRKEIIVVDDGSTDHTLAIAQQYASGYVHVVTQNNAGAAAARNKAYALSQGDYIQWLDADDLLAPDKIAKQMEVGIDESKRILLSSSWGYFFYCPRKARFVRTSLWQDLEPVDWLLNKLNENIWMTCQSWLVSRELSQMAGPWDTRLCADDDGEYFSRVILSSELIKFVPDAISYVSTANADSLSKNFHMSERKVRSQFESICLQIKYLRSIEDSERTRAACLKELQRWLIYFYPEFPDIVACANSLAGKLGGQLRIPELSWKWDWLRRLFGWEVAKRISLAMQGTSVLPSKTLDYILSKLE
jgi:glycosyltransferase involved in cell wall biosynthesis